MNIEYEGSMCVFTFILERVFSPLIVNSNAVSRFGSFAAGAVAYRSQVIKNQHLKGAMGLKIDHDPVAR